MVGSRPRHRNVQQLEQLAEHMRLEVCSMASMDYVRDSKTRNEFVDKHAGYRCCLLVRQRVSLHVLRKVIDHCQDITVSTQRTGERAEDVHSDTREWCPRINRSKGSAVARVSLVAIAGRAFLSPVLNVFTDL